MSLRGRWSALRALLSRRPDPDVDDELAFHLEQRVRDYVARGMDEASARRAALERLGDLDRVRRECAELAETERRAARRRDWIGDLGQDVAFGWRSMARAPPFAALTIVTLALGVGANAAVFTVVKSVLLDALPYRDAGRLVRVYARLTDGTVERAPLSAGALRDYEERARSLADVAVFFATPFDAVHGADDGPRVFKAMLVGPDYFPLLGVTPALGRSFTRAEAERNELVAVLNHATWQDAFGGDPGIVGRVVHFNSNAYTVVGVLPRDFVAPTGSADVWFALRFGASLQDPERARRSRSWGMLARLTPGTEPARAQAELSAIAARLEVEHPETDAGQGVQVVPLRRAMAGDARLPLIVLMASATLVLLVACTNLAGAMLSRSISRRQEFAARVALGAGRGRLVRQLLTESTMLSLLGTTAGLALAALGLVLVRRLAAQALPLHAHLALDGGVVMVMASVALCAGIGIGLLPAFAASRSDVGRALRDSLPRAGESPRSRRVRGLLVSAQIALCLTLLVGAGLLGRSLRAITAAPLGYDPPHVLTFSVKGPVPAPDADRARFFEALLEHAGSLPGVVRAAHTDALPSAEMRRAELVIRDAEDRDPASPPLVDYAVVSDGYFETMGIGLAAGRTFDARDGGDAAQAVVVSATVARRFWPAGDAVGARIRLGTDASAPWAQVIGVVGDVRADPTRPEPTAMAYGSVRQDPLRSSRTYVVRTATDPRAIVPALRRELAALDATVPMTDVVTLEESLAGPLGRRELPTVLLSVFAVLTLVLASIGVYALFANMAAAREREFGVRLALGAKPGSIVALLARQGATWLVAGLLGGVIGVAFVTRALDSLLFGVRPLDPRTLVAAFLLLAACALLALLVPIRRVARSASRRVLS